MSNLNKTEKIKNNSKSLFITLFPEFLKVLKIKFESQHKYVTNFNKSKKMSSKYKPFGTNKPNSLALISSANLNNVQVNNAQHSHSSHNSWSKSLWNENDFVIKHVLSLNCGYAFFNFRRLWMKDTLKQFGTA